MAVTVHVPLPVPLVETVIPPAVPAPLPTAGEAHATEADVAFRVFQAKVDVAPAAITLGEKDVDSIEGAATTLVEPEAVATAPNAFVTVTEHVPVPNALVAKLREPLLAALLPLTTPLQFTETVAPPLVAHEKTARFPAVALGALKLALAIAGAATTVTELDRDTCVPAGFTATTVQVPAPDPLVLTVRFPVRPLPDPAALPAQLTDAELALAVDQLNPTAVPAVTLPEVNDALVTTGAAIPDPLTAKPKLLAP
jgi:hypothetical protein